jgi:hypothetical protein
VNYGMLHEAGKLGSENKVMPLQNITDEVFLK